MFYQGGLTKTHASVSLFQSPMFSMRYLIKVYVRVKEVLGTPHDEEVIEK